MKIIYTEDNKTVNMTGDLAHIGYIVNPLNEKPELRITMMVKGKLESLKFEIAPTDEQIAKAKEISSLAMEKKLSNNLDLVIYKSVLDNDGNKYPIITLIGGERDKDDKVSPFNWYRNHIFIME